MTGSVTPASAAASRQRAAPGSPGRGAGLIDPGFAAKREHRARPFLDPWARTHAHGDWVAPLTISSAALLCLSRTRQGRWVPFKLLEDEGASVINWPDYTTGTLQTKATCFPTGQCQAVGSRTRRRERPGPGASPAPRTCKCLLLRGRAHKERKRTGRERELQGLR